MIKNRLGFSFAIPIVIGAIVLTLMGVITAFESPIGGIIMIAIAPFFWSSSYGFQIDAEGKNFREYGSVYGIKTGKWRPLEKVPFITIVRGRTGTAVYSQSNRSTTNIDDRLEVCLLNNTHRFKAVVKKFEDKNEAQEYANLLAKKFSKSLVQYSPAVSEKTRNRRSGH